MQLLFYVKTIVFIIKIIKIIKAFFSFFIQGEMLLNCVFLNNDKTIHINTVLII